MYDESQIRRWMRMAVDLGRQSISEGDSTKPYVGAVVVQVGEVIGSGYRGMTGSGNHAEFGVLQGMTPESLEGAVVFSTLEPCSTRNHPKIPCAQRLADAKVSEVYIGIYDPNPVIYRQGWKILNEAGVVLRDFSADLRDEIAVDNYAFLARFKTATGDSGEFRFDYPLTGGNYTFETSIGRFVVTVSERGWGSTYLYDETNKVGHPRFATEFDQIDDPGALEFSARYVTLAVGEIACLRSPQGYLLLKLIGAHGNVGNRGVEV